MNDHLEKVLYHESTILARLDELAAEITSEYRGKRLTVVAIMQGSVIFLSDLLRRIYLPLKVETISVSSYHGGTESSGVVTVNQLAMPDFSGEHVLLLDDILDSGRTLHAISNKLRAEAGPESVKICVLLQKIKDRAEDVCADYVAFEIGDDFVVGYGLDYNGHYRNLPLIGTLKPELIT
jgi:hypoxanthine phosphoribosyltransferase